MKYCWKVTIQIKDSSIKYLVYNIVDSSVGRACQRAADAAFKHLGEGTEKFIFVDHVENLGEITE